MSIDDRLREGLPLALDELLPDDVEQGLALTLHRVERRRGLRRGGYAVALVAAAAVVAAVSPSGSTTNRGRSSRPTRRPTRCWCWTPSSVRPTSRLRWSRPRTPSASSVPRTMRPGRRSRCPPAGATTGSTRRQDPTSTPTCAASSCPPWHRSLPTPAGLVRAPAGPEAADLMTSLAAPTDRATRTATSRHHRRPRRAGAPRCAYRLDVDVTGCATGTPWSPS